MSMRKDKDKEREDKAAPPVVQEALSENVRTEWGWGGREEEEEENEEEKKREKDATVSCR